MTLNKSEMDACSEIDSVLTQYNNGYIEIKIRIFVHNGIPYNYYLQQV